MSLNGWATERCEKHDMVSCADCLEQLRMRRDVATGEVRYRDDCGVATFAEITGADYEFAADVLREAGFAPGLGTPSKGLRAAFESVGFRVVDVTAYGLENARFLSEDGADFYVCGWTTGRNPSGHAWTIQNGKAARDFLRNRRIIFQIFQVTA